MVDENAALNEVLNILREHIEELGNRNGIRLLEHYFLGYPQLNRVDLGEWVSECPRNHRHHIGRRSEKCHSCAATAQSALPNSVADWKQMPQWQALPRAFKRQ